MNPGGRLTVVKFYDFDGVWHAWAGDFLAACAWTLDNRETYRIRSVLLHGELGSRPGHQPGHGFLPGCGHPAGGGHGQLRQDPAGPGYPAVLPQVLTVGSTDPDGAVSGSAGVAFPGSPSRTCWLPVEGNILAADNEPNDTYSIRQGTSLAAAHVAGAANLLEEALVDNGLHLPADGTAVRTRMALLRGTAARVDLAAGPDGSGSGGSFFP